MSEYPLVTFTLIAFNQEAYIGAAVRGALAQTYEPLEIIISDDCSTDRTFEIIQEITRAYDGSHKVVTRRNDVNLGVTDHVNLMFEIASSDIIIYSAGDDVSLPERTARILDAFDRNPTVQIVHSSVYRIGANGEDEGIWKPSISQRDSRLSSNLLAMSIIIGAASAYKKSLYTEFGKIVERDAIEDLVLAFRAMMNGGLYYLDEPLVYYKANTGITSPKRKRLLDPRTRHLASLNRNAAIYRQRLADLARTQERFPPRFSARISREVQIISHSILFHTNRWELIGRFILRPILVSRAILYSIKSILYDQSAPLFRQEAQK